MTPKMSDFQKFIYMKRTSFSSYLLMVKKISGTDLHFILESSDKMNKSLQCFFTLLLCIKPKQTEWVAILSL